MMLYDIRHITRFDYAGNVRFARCNLRLQPIDWPGQSLEDYALTVEPVGRLRPARAEAGLANVARLTIDTPVRELTIESRSRMRVDRLVPVPDAGDPTLGEIASLARASRDLSAAGPANYLFPSPLIPLDHAIAAYCAPDLDPTRGSLEAGIALARRIQADFAFDPTATLVDTPPHEAFLKRKGVCQDFAHLTLVLLRGMGIPARYVSGYLHPRRKAGIGETVKGQSHAWVQAWTGSWWNYDPTNDKEINEQYVSVGTGRDYSDVSPLKGIYSGGGSTDLDVRVEITRLA